PDRLSVTVPQAGRNAGDLETPVRDGPRPAPLPAGVESLERFTRALYDLLLEQGGAREWRQRRSQLLAQYERAVGRHTDLRLRESNQQGRMAVGAISVLSQRSADRVEELVKKALANKGYDARLVQLVAQQVHEQLLAEVQERP
ncbi:MAG: hypothetical protein L0Z62_39275, partial [Gemmataceae bacterium]|nr:hypothetical protein [Gemmataceae bacterium]